MTPYDTRDLHETDEDDAQDEVQCKRCGQEGLTLMRINGVPKLFLHVGLHLREHKCDFTNTSGFD